MRLVPIIFLAAIASLWGYQTASAADGVMNAPMPAAAKSWTGCYVGGNVGYGWLHSDWSHSGSSVGSGSDGGFVGGGQVGCDYQVGKIVFGAQGMFDGASITESHGYNGGNTYIDHTKTSWFGTLTGRLGYAFSPSLMVYAKGGAAWIHSKFSETCSPSNPSYYCPGEDSATEMGWTVGAGAEYRFRPNWSAFVEYNYMDFGTSHSRLVYQPGSPNKTYDYDVKQRLQNVLLGVNYRF